MKALKILVIMLVLIMSVGVACAADAVSSDDTGADSQEILQTVQEDTISDNTQNGVSDGSFTDLIDEINKTTGVLNLNRNYKFNESDDEIGITIVTDNLVIEGNGYTIDGNNQARAFIIDAKNVTLNNLKIINTHRATGGAIFIDPTFSLTTNNVTFENNSADNSIIYVVLSTYQSNNDKFLDATVPEGGVISVESGNLAVDNALMVSSKQLTWGFIKSDMGSTVTVLNSIFRDTISNYSTAMNVGGSSRIKNTKFINLEATITAGAIAAREFDECEIEDCTFINVSSDKNGGAIFADVKGFKHSEVGILTVNGTTFINCSSGFGGAILHLGSYIAITNSTFKDNFATFDGGAVYISNAKLSITNSTFDCNGALYDGPRGSFGGVLYSDLSEVIVDSTNFTNSCAQGGAALYLYDSSYAITNSIFENNVNFNGRQDDVYTVFDGDVAVLDNATNTYSSNDSVSLNNKDYATIIASEGMALVLINNTIDVTELPSRFDLRDWGWLTPVKNQGNKGACWTFGSSGAMESAILRYLGIEMDLSENNMEDVSLKYYKYGLKGVTEGNTAEEAVEYALSWFGVFDEEYDIYDQLGKISPIFASNNSIHFQDVVIVPPRQNSTDNDPIKWAVLKYGALFINYYANGSNVEQYYSGPTHVNNAPNINHGVCIVGWDDNREIAGAPGKGAWIIKNSWGTSAGEEGFMYISYYDTCISTVTSSYAFLLENDVIYNKNYQYDIGGQFVFFNISDAYRNNFAAVEDDLIAAVGTYFNQSGVNYTVKIDVNGQCVLMQDGVSPFAGYHTIKLDSYVPIKKGDAFTVTIKSNSVPILVNSRQHYMPGSSEALNGTEWMSIFDGEVMCCIKAYTLADDSKVINNKDISVDYGGGKYFSVKVVTADGHAVGVGESVKFTINGKTTTVKTDKNGIAEIKIIDTPGTYTIKTTYKGKTYTNKVTVKQVITTSKVTVKKTAKSFAMQAKLKVNGKLVKGKTIKFKLNGKTYTAKTNSKGIAKVTVKKNDIGKLKKGKTYTVQVTYSKDTIKTTVKVK